MTTLLFNSALDDRFKHGEITSRVGLSEPANLYTKDTNLLDVYKELCEKNGGHFDCVLVDEAQFLSKEQVYQLTNICDLYKVPVLCYGLRTDFQGELFEGSQSLLAWADKLIELKAVCYCGKKATHVIRIDKDGNALSQGEKVQIGSESSYESVCRYHYKERLGLIVSAI